MAIDDQAYKDALRAIESGEIPEDLDLPDPEEYDDMGGIKSLDRGAPSIKMASETSDEEAQMEIGQMLEAFQEAVRQGFKGDIKEFSDYYFGQMKMDQDRAMAMYGGSMRSKYGEGTPMRPVPEELLALIRGLKPTRDPDPEKFAEEIEKSKLRELMPEFKKDAELLPKRLSKMEKDYPDAMKKKYKFMELMEDDEDDIPDVRPGQQNSIEDILRMLKESEEKKKKRAKGGIAGVL